MNKYVQKLKCVRKCILIVNTQTKQKKYNDQTKTKLSPQGPQWSHSVAHVQRRGDFVHSHKV